MMRAITCTILSVLITADSIEASVSTYKVYGKFTCGREASGGKQTSVKLLDQGLGLDTRMGKMEVNADGSFVIDGTANRIIGLFSINPELHIYTTCARGWQVCPRKWTLKLPKKYINDKQGFDIGTINLEMEWVGEETDCIH